MLAPSLDPHGEWSEHVPPAQGKSVVLASEGLRPTLDFASYSPAPSKLLYPSKPLLFHVENGLDHSG